ncbi:intestinal mucin-like protein [Brachionichthys hirsutus]|uniref:intestinal mucin-like protein n=1 Tax=Brachionichthys hirsutus TaxID=412623 RepID=UPI0036053EB5
MLTDGETWKTGKCSNHSCYDGKLTTDHVYCKPVAKPVCDNKLPPVKVYDVTGCCFSYKCRCICKGWGGPHYMTFDGQYYSFQRNCTYVLVTEVNPQYNFTVVIDDGNCNASEKMTCIKSMKVYYKKSEIILALQRFPVNKTMVYVDSKQVFPTYTNPDFTITSTGIEVLLKIPAIEAHVVFKDLLFSVELPISLFQGKTEGQCGNCDNDMSNDCRLPNGQTNPSCFDMAQHCVFKKCHDVVSPQTYYSSCVFDVCAEASTAVSCSSLEAYALACAEESVCVDWRKTTNGQCEYECPENKVYKPCGPAISPTCNSRYNEQNKKNCSESESSRDCGGFNEGCFCPDGMTLFSQMSDICVDSCCVGPNGQPKKLGETWRSDCRQCVCDENTQTVQCEPVKCPSLPSIKCTEMGTVEVNRLVDCCPKTFCVPKPVCVFNKIEYQGYKYEEQNGQCCGICKQISCILDIPDIDLPIIIEGTEQSVKDGCCKTCIPIHRCQMKKNAIHLKKNGCQTVVPVDIGACEGSCGASSSVYSVESNSIIHSCQCCQQAATSEREVELTCSDDTKMNYSYTR